MDLLRYVGAGKLSRPIAAAAATAARGMAFRPYNWAGAMASVVSDKVHLPTQLFCSELVATAFHEAGVDAVPGVLPNRVTPALLEKSPAFFAISPLPLIRMEFPKSVAMADRSESYAESGMARENRLSRLAFTTLKGELPALQPSAPAGLWPPRDLAALIDLLALCDPIASEPIALRLHGILEQGGYYLFIDEQMMADILSRASSADGTQALGWYSTLNRARRNAVTCIEICKSRRWPLFDSLALMHSKNAVFFAELVSRAGGNSRSR